MTLLDEVFSAHGGLERWRRVERVAMRGAVVGELWPRRGLEGLLADAHIVLETGRQASAYRDFGGPGRTGHFTPERVWITAAAGTVVSERENPRDKFEGQAMTAPWDPLDALFANGFGTWTEVMLPFALAMPGVAVRELDPVDDGRGHWRRLAADFPPSIVTHREQELWICPDGLVDRAQFVPGVGGVVPSAVFWSDYRDVDGIRFPTRRRMVPIRDGTPQDAPMVLDEHDLAFTLG